MITKAPIFLLFGTMTMAQCKYTADEVALSNDPQVIANFIKFNGTHPKTPLFKEKLYNLINHPTAETATGVATAKPAPNSTLMKKEEEQHKENTVNILNHLFDSDPNKKDAYVIIENHSDCDITMLFSGKKSYSLEIKQKNKNFIIVDKDTYRLSSDVCRSKYSSLKKINKDISVGISISH